MAYLHRNLPGFNVTIVSLEETSDDPEQDKEKREAILNGIDTIKDDLVKYLKQEGVVEPMNPLAPEGAYHTIPGGMNNQIGAMDQWAGGINYPVERSEPDAETITWNLSKDKVKVVLTRD